VADYIEFGNGQLVPYTHGCPARAGVRPADQPVPEQRLWRETGAERIKLVLQLLSLVAGYRVVAVPSVNHVVAESSEAK